MLGLAASHLSGCTESDYSTQALNHRVTAISLVNIKLTEPVLNVGECDALFAAILCLTHQTLFLEDAMMEFLTMLRGCNLVATSVIPKFEGQSAFRRFTPDGHANSMRTIVREQGEPPKDLRLLGAFERAVLQLRPLCQRPTEVGYLDALHRVVELVGISSGEGE
jgi:hypothetical protein